MSELRIGRKMGWTLVVSSIAVVVISVLADALGIGAGDYVFGWEQKVGVAVGCTVATCAALSMRGWRLPVERRHAPMTTGHSASA